MFAANENAATLRETPLVATGPGFPLDADGPSGSSGSSRVIEQSSKLLTTGRESTNFPNSVLSSLESSSLIFSLSHRSSLGSGEEVADLSKLPCRNFRFCGKFGSVRRSLKSRTKGRGRPRETRVSTVRRGERAASRFAFARLIR